MAETSSGNPYTDRGDERIFSEDVEDAELIWHRDKYNREITILEGVDWQLQLDNELRGHLREEEFIRYLQCSIIE